MSSDWIEMSSNNRMRAALAGVATVAVMGSGIALAPDASAATSIKAKAYSTGKAQIGDPYKYGAAGPNAFDCSGLIYYSYKKNGKTLPRVAQSQYNKSKHISKANRQVGDLVFFGSTGNIYHVGFYAGNGKVLHAPKPGRDVKYEKIWTSQVHYGRFN